MQTRVCWFACLGNLAESAGDASFWAGEIVCHDGINALALEVLRQNLIIDSANAYNLLKRSLIMIQDDAEKFIDDAAAVGQRVAEKAKRSAAEALDAASDRMAVARDRRPPATTKNGSRSSRFSSRLA